MASRFWLGVNNDTTDTANWSATRGGTGGQTVPGNSDAANFLDGTGDLNANAAFAAATAVFGGNFTGNIAGLQSNFASAVWTVESQAAGKVFNIGPAVGVTMAAIHVKTAKGTVNIVGGAATLTLLRVGKNVGKLNVDPTCIVTTYDNAGAPDYVGYNSTAITTGQWGGGGNNHRCCRSITTGTVNGPTILQVLCAGGSPTATTLTVNDRSTIAWDSDGTVTTANVKDGGTWQPVSTKHTVTTMNLWEGGIGNQSSDKVAVGTLVPIGNA